MSRNAPAPNAGPNTGIDAQRVSLILGDLRLPGPQLSPAAFPPPALPPPGRAPPPRGRTATAPP